MTKPVGIVLVSHSAELAAGVGALLGQIASADVPIELAGGTDDGRIGTSYDRVAKAIANADHGGGVVVLPDLGSSVLTTRAVLADHPRADVRVVDAPFVEGAVAAAVTAAGGADLFTVFTAAEEARDVSKF